MRKKLFIFGAGAVVKDICKIIDKINDIKPTWSVLGFVDNDKKLSGQKILGLPIVNISELPDSNKIYGICGIMDPKLKKKIVNEEIINKGYKLGTIIHPDIEFPEDVIIKNGSIVFSGVQISCNVKIGSCVWLDKNVLIGHDTSIGDFSSILPSTIISGMCNLGSGCTIGAGAKLYQNVSVGRNSLVGIGTTITNDIQKHTSVINLPRNIVREIK